MSFPPTKGTKQVTTPPRQIMGSIEGSTTPTSTGGGGLTASKAMKNAAIRPSPGIEKVNSAS